MKKLLTPFLILLFVVLVQETSAQARAGLGFVYGSEVEEFGFNFNGEYGINENISLNANISIFFIEDVPGVDNGFWTLNFDGHYYFQGGLSGFYGLAGLNIATATFEGEILGFPVDESSSELGLNIGGGYLYDTGGAIAPFGDVKFVLGDADQLVFRAGAKYNF